MEKVSKTLKINGYGVNEDMKYACIRGYQLANEGFKIKDEDRDTIVFIREETGEEVELRFGW